MDKKSILIILDRHLKNQSNAKEKQKLDEFFEENSNDIKASKSIENIDKLEDKIFNYIQFGIKEQVKNETKLRRIPYLQIAASILLLFLFSTTVYFYRSSLASRSNLPEAIVSVNIEDKQPAKNIAILTLGNNSKIILDEASYGEIAQESGVSIMKTEKGELVYKIKNTDKLLPNDLNKYNIISTPMGGKFKVILPDGSLVVLNAASTLKYPIHFDEKLRKVSFTGEAYFEIAKKVDAHKQRIPFYVYSNNQIVEVLGTHFNINSYDNEEYSKTTLLEGSVKIINEKSNSNAKILQPGQQAVIKKGDVVTKILVADQGQAIAWKEGYFLFKNTNIKDVVNELERWYNVEIEYNDDMESENITGYISRNVKISSVLKMLQLSGIVNYEINGSKIIIKGS
ncbi:MAG: FecR domain-containing protein [Chitinophagia bacterium]